MTQMRVFCFDCLINCFENMSGIIKTTDECFHSCNSKNVFIW